MNSNTLQETKRFFQKVFGWMFVGLTVSGVVAYLTATTPAVYEIILSSKAIFYGILLGELLLVIVLSALMQKISANTAGLLFIIYCIATGLTLSVIFFIFTISSIGTVFFITAGTFGLMSLYGYTTDQDLTQMGQLLFMGLIGIILAGLVNMFLQNETIDYVTSIIGVVIFTGLTAYDVQKLKETNIIGNEGTEQDSKEAITGALTLYLDFINLFLKLLSLFGKKR